MVWKVGNANLKVAEITFTGDLQLMSFFSSLINVTFFVVVGSQRNPLFFHENFTSSIIQ